MNETLQFVVRHGYLLVFAWVFIEQAGLPIPSAPLLLAVGALSGMHQMNLGVAITIAAFAAVASDSMWYQIGRQKGVRVLQLLCRISLEPDSCVRRTQVSFGRNGAGVLLGAKFIPGLNAMAAPLAGIIRMGWRKFLLYDVLGALALGGASTRYRLRVQRRTGTRRGARGLSGRMAAGARAGGVSRAIFSGNSINARRFLRKLEDRPHYARRT